MGLVDMQLTKLTHSCVRVDTGAGVLVLDPGSFSEAARALEGADACLVTHQHADHLDAPVLAAALRDQPDLRVWAPQEALALLREELGDHPAASRLTAVGPDERLEVGGTSVRTFGGQHALIHGSIPVVSNVGYLVGERLYHPGDSFAVPPADVDTLLLPTHAPWSKVGEVLDFLIAVRPRQVFQVHDALLNELGTGLVEGHVARLADRYAATFVHLQPGESREL